MMATKIIKAWINGAVQEIEVEDITSPAQPLSVDERVEKLEDKHKVIIADGNFLVGNGTEEMEEITPDEVLSHINGASVTTLTTEAYESLTSDQINANTLYMITDAEEEVQYIAQDTAPDDTSVLWVDTSDDTSDFEQISIDTSLSISGYAADAKAVGDALEEKQPKGNYLTEVPSEYVTEEELSAKGYLTGYTETDPTVPAWAKENTKPTYTANEVGADASGTASSLVEAHNVASDAHDDIREQIVQVSNEISNLKKIYVGNTAPTDISDGTIWIDTSEE